MAKAKKAVKATRRKPKKYVWHIFHFRQRFELPDNVRFDRQRPLVYTRDFVGSGQDDESVSYHQQINVLRRGDNYLAKRGAWHELKENAANRSQKYRGYLLDEKLRPASDARIGQWLGIDAKQAAGMLRALEAAGLIERVELPDFDDGDKPKGPPHAPKKKVVKKKVVKKKATRKKAVKKVKKPAKTKTSKNLERARDPLESSESRKNRKGKGKAKSESEVKVKKIKTTKIKKEKPQPGHHPSETTKTGLKARSGAEGAVCSGEVKRPEQSTDRDSTKSDGFCSQAAQATASPSASATKSDGGVRSSNGQQRPDGLPLSFDPPDFDRVYNPDCKQFAIEVFMAIGTPFAPDSPEAAGNLGCFAARWQDARQSDIGHERLQMLWTSAIVNARKLKAKRRRVHFTESPEAVWVWQFKRSLAKMVRERGTAVKPPKAGHG